MLVKNLTIIYFFLSTFLLNAQTVFDKGFIEGFKKGYCYTNNQSGIICTPPLPPSPPLPQINENNNSYQDGYNRGFLYGLTSRKKDDKKSSNKNVNPNSPPKFNSYVPQNAITNLTPQERAAYYAVKARQEQEAANALGALFEDIFIGTPENRARRKLKKQNDLIKSSEKDFFYDIKKMNSNNYGYTPLQKTNLDIIKNYIDTLRNNHIESEFLDKNIGTYKCNIKVYENSKLVKNLIGKIKVEKGFIKFKSNKSNWKTVKLYNESIDKFSKRFVYKPLNGDIFIDKDFNDIIFYDIYYDNKKHFFFKIIK